MATYASGKTIILKAKLNAADTSLTADIDVGVTAGRLYFVNDNQKEWLSFTSVTASGSNFVYSGLTRGLSQTANPATAGTGLTWIAGNSAALVAMHDQLADTKTDNTFSGTQTFTDLDFTGTTTGGLKVKPLTTTQRNALTPANGMIIYDTTLGEHYQYIAGAWSAIAAGSTQPNASATVAGKLEVATTAQSIAGTDTGETGALLSALPSDIAKNEQSDTFKYGADAGGDDTYVIALTPVLTAYTVGQKLRFKATTANTGACSIDFGPGVKSIKDRAGNDPVTGLITASDFTDVYYDGTNFVIDSAPKLATDAEVVTGTDITKYITAKQAKDNYGLIDSIVLTRDVAAASGTVTYNHSLGKVPTFITIDSITTQNGSTLETSSHGTWKTPTTNKCAYGAGNSITATTSASFSVIGMASATLGTSGVIQNVTSTQFDIVWTKNGAPAAGQILSANVVLI